MSGNKLYYKAVFTLLLFFSLANAYSQKVSGDCSQDTLMVMTFNIFHGEMYYSESEDKLSNLEEVASLINLLNPDLVALQEVDRNTGRSQGRDLLKELAVLTDMKYVFGRSMDFDGGEYGLGILSKYSFSFSQVHPLHSPEGSEPRIALESRFIIESGDTLRFVSTHFDHRNAVTREKQAMDINRLFCSDNLSSIIAGDFNAPPDSKTIKHINSYWTNCSPGNEPTSPSVKPTRKIDYIFFRGGKLKVKESKVIEEKSASDHNPVISVFTFSK